jgi:hypothetical protein
MAAFGRSRLRLYRNPSEPRPSTAPKPRVAPDAARSNRAFDNSAAASTSSDNKRNRLVAFTSRLAHWLRENHLLSLEGEPEESMDPDIEFSINQLAILDTPGERRTAGYSTVELHGQVFLTRDRRLFCHKTDETRIKLMYPGVEVAGPADFEGLQRALPVLLEVAKFPAWREREQLLKEIDRATELNDTEAIRALIPHASMDPVIRQHLERLLDPMAQLLKQKLADNAMVAESINATRAPELSLEQMTEEFSKATSTVGAMKRFRDRYLRRRGLRLVERDDLERRRRLGRGLS